MRMLGLFVVLTGLLAAPSTSHAIDLTIGVNSEATALDPHFFRLASNMEINKLLYSALVTTDIDLKIVPDLAESWRTIDATTWEFKLRPGMTFHDGTPFTADDVVFTLTRARDVPNSPASFQQFLRRVTKATAIDATTLRVETDRADPILLNELQNVVIVSRRIGGTATTADYNSGKAAIGTGPYRLVEWLPGNRLVLRRTDSYFGRKPDWEHVTYKPVTNNAARSAALLSGDVDLINAVPTEDVEMLRGKPGITVTTMPSSRIYYLDIDMDRDNSPFVTDSDGRPMTKNPMKDLRVRRALSKAIDRAALVSRVMSGQAVTAAQFMPEGVGGISSKLVPEPFDLPGAQKLMAEAGWADGFGLTLHATNDRYPNDAQVIQAVAQMWTRLGVRTKVEPMPKNVFFPRAAKREFSALLGGNSSDTAEPLSQQIYILGTINLQRGIGAGNLGGYSNARVDALLDQATGTLDDAKRNAMTAEVFEIALGQDVAKIPMYFALAGWAMRKGVAYEGFWQEMTIASYARNVK